MLRRSVIGHVDERSGLVHASSLSPKRLTRIAGLLYLIVGIFSGFALAHVTPKV